MVVDGKESNSFFDEMHEWSHNFDKEIRIETNGVSGILKEIYKDYIDHFIITGNGKAEPVGLLSTVNPEIGNFKTGLKKVGEQKMKETMKESLQKMKDEKQKQQTVEWLNTSIQKLEDFKSQVESGKIVMTDGYMDDNYPVPQLTERTENNLSLSIDFIEKKTPPGQNF